MQIFKDKTGQRSPKEKDEGKKKQERGTTEAEPFDGGAALALELNNRAFEAEQSISNAQTGIRRDAEGNDLAGYDIGTLEEGVLQAIDTAKDEAQRLRNAASEAGSPKSFLKPQDYATKKARSLFGNVKVETAKNGTKHLGYITAQTKAYALQKLKGNRVILHKLKDISSGLVGNENEPIWITTDEQGRKDVFTQEAFLSAKDKTFTGPARDGGIERKKI